MEHIGFSSEIVKIVAQSSEIVTTSLVFHNFEPQFSIFLMRNRHIPFKCPLYNFLRAFKWYAWFFIKMNLKIHVFEVTVRALYGY